MLFLGRYVYRSVIATVQCLSGPLCHEDMFIAVSSNCEINSGLGALCYEDTILTESEKATGQSIVEWVHYVLRTLCLQKVSKQQLKSVLGALCLQKC